MEEEKINPIEEKLRIFKMKKLDKTRVSKHLGSKKRKNKKKDRADEKRARQSRRVNR